MIKQNTVNKVHNILIIKKIIIIIIDCYTKLGNVTVNKDRNGIAAWSKGRTI